MSKEDDLGLTDLDQKWVLTARRLDRDAPRFALLWRTKGKSGKPLPKVGQIMTLPGNIRVRIERIDPPGTPLNVTDRTLVIRVTKADS